MLSQRWITTISATPKSIFVTSHIGMHVLLLQCKTIQNSYQYNDQRTWRINYMVSSSCLHMIAKKPPGIYQKVRLTIRDRGGSAYQWLLKACHKLLRSLAPHQRTTVNIHLFVQLPIASSPFSWFGTARSRSNMVTVFLHATSPSLLKSVSHRPLTSHLPHVWACCFFAMPFYQSSRAR